MQLLASSRNLSLRYIQTFIWVHTATQRHRALFGWAIRINRYMQRVRGTNLASVYTTYNDCEIGSRVSVYSPVRNLVQNLGSRRRNIHNFGARVSLGEMKPGYISVV